MCIPSNLYSAGLVVLTLVYFLVERIDFKKIIVSKNEEYIFDQDSHLTICAFDTPRGISFKRRIHLLSALIYHLISIFDLDIFHLCE